MMRRYTLSVSATAFMIAAVAPNVLLGAMISILLLLCGVGYAVLTNEPATNDFAYFWYEEGWRGTPEALAEIGLWLSSLLAPRNLLKILNDVRSRAA
jgi:hypothetical protein